MRSSRSFIYIICALYLMPMPMYMCVCVLYSLRNGVQILLVGLYVCVSGCLFAYLCIYFSLVCTAAILAKGFSFCCVFCCCFLGGVGPFSSSLAIHTQQQVSHLICLIYSFPPLPLPCKSKEEAYECKATRASVVCSKLTRFPHFSLSLSATTLLFIHGVRGWD